jgi:hypothetical protein
LYEPRVHSKAQLSQEQRAYIKSLLLPDFHAMHQMTISGRAIAVRSSNLVTLLAEIAEGKIPVRGSRESFMTGIGENGLFYMNTLSRSKYFEQKPEILTYLDEDADFLGLTEQQITEKEVQDNLQTYAAPIAVGTFFSSYLPKDLKPSWKEAILKFEQVATRLDKYPLPPDNVTEALEAFFTRVATDLFKFELGRTQNAYSYKDLAITNRANDLQMEFSSLAYIKRLLAVPEKTEPVLEQLGKQVRLEDGHIAAVLFGPDVMKNADIHYWTPNDVDPLVNIENELVVKPRSGMIDISSIAGVLPMGRGAQEDLKQLAIF